MCADDADAELMDGTKPSSKETPAIELDESGSTLAGGAGDGGFVFNERIIGRESDSVSAGAVNENQTATQADEIRRVLSNLNEFTENSYRFFWNEVKEEGLQSICEYALGDHPDKETRGGRRSRRDPMDSMLL